MNEQSAIERLSAVASPPLANSIPILSSDQGKRFEELAALLSARNGFYAFESALHVFPSGELDDLISVERWNDPAVWKADYQGLADDLWCFAEDVFGVQFAIHADKVVQFDPETGDRAIIAGSIPAWVDEVLRDYPRLSGYPIARAWQVEHGALTHGQRLLPVTPFVLGGPFEVANLFAGDAVEGMRSRGNLAVQIRDLPNGAVIDYVARR